MEDKSKRFRGRYTFFGLILLTLLILFETTPAAFTIVGTWDYKINFLITVGYIIFSLAFYQIFYRKQWSNKSLPEVLKVLIKGFISILILSFLLDLIFGSKVSVSKNQKIIEDMLQISFSPAFVMSIVLLAPIVEEYGFREYLPGILHRLFNKKNSRLMDFIFLLFSNVIFSLMHMPTDLYSFLSYFNIGLVLVWVRFTTNSLKMSAYLHSLWNFSSVVILYFLI